MLFFRNKNKHAHESCKLSKAAISSIISQGMHIDGEIRFKGKFRIDGTVEGNIQGEYLIISETGKVNGDMKLDVLICHGTIDGNIEARQVNAHATSSIRGTVKSENLTVETGAAIDGEFKAFSEKENKTKESKITAETKSRDNNIPAGKEK